MTNLLAILLFGVLSFPILTKEKFIGESDSFTTSMLNDYSVIQTGATMNRYATSGSTWNKHVYLKSKKPFVNKYKQKDYQEYTFTFIYFEHKDSCMKARREYLDHFSELGKLTTETKGIKRSPSFNLINENSFIIFEVDCEGHEMDEKWSWTKIKESLTTTFGSGDSETIENGCGGPITWINNRDK